MRVTAGEFRGRRLEAPKGPEVRSTMDHVRQAMFNLLGDVSGKKVLDLFSGSGALGIEALSRGAVQVTFVDRSGFCVRTIEENLKNLRGQTPFAPKGSDPVVIQANVLAAIRQFREKGVEFDLVFLDPPYGRDLARKSLITLGQYAIIPLLGLVVAEQDKREIVPAEIEGKEARLILQRSVRYGDTALTFYQRQ